MKLSDMRPGVFWLEQIAHVCASVFVLRPLGVGRWQVLICYDDPAYRSVVTDWHDYERSPVTKALR